LSDPSNAAVVTIDALSPTVMVTGFKTRDLKKTEVKLTWSLSDKDVKKYKIDTYQVECFTEEGMKDHLVLTTKTKSAHCKYNFLISLTLSVPITFMNERS
jgi:hypothetical protein